MMIILKGHGGHHEVCVLTSRKCLLPRTQAKPLPDTAAANAFRVTTPVGHAGSLVTAALCAFRAVFRAHTVSARPLLFHVSRGFPVFFLKPLNMFRHAYFNKLLKRLKANIYANSWLKKHWCRGVHDASFGPRSRVMRE